MYGTSKAPVWRRGILNNLLATLSTRPAAALLTTPLVHLITGTPTLTPDMPIATLSASEATFTGYAPIALTPLVGPVNLNAGADGLLCTVNFLEAAPGTVQNNVTGYYVDENAGVDWVLAELFPFPVPMVISGDFLSLDVLLGLPFVVITS